MDDITSTFTQPVALVNHLLKKGLDVEFPVAAHDKGEVRSGDACENRSRSRITEALIRTREVVDLAPGSR